MELDKTKWPDLSVSVRNNLTQSVNSDKKETDQDSISVHLNKLRISYESITTIATQINLVLKHNQAVCLPDKKLLVVTFSQIGVLASQVNLVALKCTYQLETILSAMKLTNYETFADIVKVMSANFSRKESLLLNIPSSDCEPLEKPKQVVFSTPNAFENQDQAPAETTAHLDQTPPTVVSAVEDQAGNDNCFVLEPVPSTSASSIPVPSTGISSPSSELVSSTSVSEQHSPTKVPDGKPSTVDVNPGKDKIQNFMEIESSQPQDSFQSHVETESCDNLPQLSIPTLEQADDNTVGRDMPLPTSRKRKITAPNPPEDAPRRSCRRIIPPTRHDGDVQVDWNRRAPRKKIPAKDGVKKKPSAPPNSKTLTGGNDQLPKYSCQDLVQGSKKIRLSEPLEAFSDDVPTLPPAASTHTVPKESSSISVTEGGNHQKKKTTKPKRKSKRKEDLHSVPNREETLPATPVNISLNSSREDAGTLLNSVVIAGEPPPQPESCSKEPSGPILMRFKKISTRRVKSILVSERTNSIQSESSSLPDDLPFAVHREESEPIANEGETSCESNETNKAPIVNDFSKSKASPSAQIEEKVQKVGRKLRSANKTLRDLSPPSPAQLPSNPAPQLSPNDPQSSANRQEDESPLIDLAGGPCPSVSNRQQEGSAKAVREKEKNSTLPPQSATNNEECDPPPSVFSDPPCASLSDRQQQDYQQEKAINSRTTKLPAIIEEEEPLEDSTAEFAQQNLAEIPASSMTQEQPIDNNKEVVHQPPSVPLSSILPPQSDPVAPPVASCSSSQLTINQSEKVTRIINTDETTEEIDILDDPDEEVAVVFANRPLKCAHCPSPTRPAFTSLAILMEHQRWKHKNILMEKCVLKRERESVGKLESNVDKTLSSQPSTHSGSQVPPKTPPKEDPPPCGNHQIEYTLGPDKNMRKVKNEFAFICLLCDRRTRFQSRDFQFHHTASHPEWASPLAHCSKCRQLLSIEDAHSHVCKREEVTTLEQSP